MPRTSTTTLSPALQEAVEKFIEYHNPSRASTNLRNMLMEALKHDLLVEEPYFNDLIHDLDGIFELLSAMDEKKA